jgi:CRISPR/Cas system endoribonuclease Cas6 (RAMP superfamily)
MRVELSRRSARTGERHPVNGVLGAAVYEGTGIAAAMPWLRLAEALGVGKHATFGNGRITVEVLR